MTNPNLVNTSQVYMRSNVQIPYTSFSDILVNPGSSNMIIRADTLTICNTTNAAISLSAQLDRSGTAYSLAKTVEIPAYSSMIVIDKDYPVYLAESDKLQVSGSAFGLQAICSYTIISDTSITLPGRPEINSTIFSSDGSTLSGWTSVNATVNSGTGNPSPSLQATGAEYAYRDLGESFLSKRITFDVYLLPGTISLCNFYFGCNSSGAGNMLRIEGRTDGRISGFATTNSWTSWNAPSGSINAYAQSTWHTIEISINSSSQASWSINGTPVQTDVAVTLSGNYFAVHGDGGVVEGALFDNIVIENI